MKLQQAGRVNYPNLANNTFVDLESSGNLKLFKNDSLIDAIRSYYKSDTNFWRQAYISRTAQGLLPKIVEILPFNVQEKIMNSEIIKDSFLMRTAKKVEKNTKMDVAVKSKTATNKEIEHKFKFDVQALQGSANFQYSGLINSRIEYQAANSTFTVSLEESLSDNSKIALTHLNDREQTRQLLQYQLNW